MGKPTGTLFTRAMAVLVMAIGSVAVADTIWLGTLPYRDRTVTAYRDGQIESTVSGRRAEPIAAERVARMEIDSEPVFTKADAAFAESNWEQAAQGYAQALKATSKPWLKSWILPRMSQAAEQANRFDLGVNAFVALLQESPQQAMKFRPSVPADADKAVLGNAAAELSKAAEAASASALQKQAALTLLLDVHRAQGDMAAAGKVGEQLLKVGNVDPNDPASARAAAGIHLSLGQLALMQKDYAKAAQQVDANRQLFSEPAEQAEALWLLAQAREGQLGASPTADTLKDVGLDYMRAIAVARKAGIQRIMAPALMRAAAVQEKLENRKGALTLYEEDATQYKSSPLAAQAAKEQARLKQELQAQ